MTFFRCIWIIIIEYKSKIDVGLFFFFSSHYTRLFAKHTQYLYAGTTKTFDIGKICAFHTFWLSNYDRFAFVCESSAKMSNILDLNGKSFFWRLIFGLFAWIVKNMIDKNATFFVWSLFFFCISCTKKNTLYLTFACPCIVWSVSFYECEVSADNKNLSANTMIVWS